MSLCQTSAQAAALAVRIAPGAGPEARRAVAAGDDVSSDVAKPTTLVKR